jgi:hypothetical protein
MLVSKITPAATKLIQINPFKTETVQGEYMIVTVSKHVIGAMSGTFNDESEFNVRFGNIKYEKKPDGTDSYPMLDIVISSRLRISQAELSSWGTDDTVVHQLILDKLNRDSGSNISIVSSEIMDMQHTA